MRRLTYLHLAGVIQLVECQLPKLDVTGSSPVARSLEVLKSKHFRSPGSQRVPAIFLGARSGTGSRVDFRRKEGLLLGRERGQKGVEIGRRRFAVDPEASRRVGARDGLLLLPHGARRSGLDSGSVARQVTMALRPAPRRSVIANVSGGMQYPREELTWADV